MIDWKSKDNLECTLCDKTINIEGLATRAIKEKLKQQNWATSMYSPKCLKHKNQEKVET